MFTVMLAQSLLGVISPNFRTVALSLKPEIWEVLFVLEKDDARDREEIAEAMDDFSCLIAGFEPHNLRLESRVLINAGPLPAMDHSQWRMVFLRRES